MFHCFNISKHINISVLFSIISISCFVSFCWIFENNCPGVGFKHDFSATEVGVSHFLCARGVRNSSFQKNSPGVCRLGGGGGEGGLGIE